MKRGLVADHGELVGRLKDVGYYRLSAYTHPFRRRNAEGVLEEEFAPNTTLEKVWNYYLFDRCLRLHFLDAIERIEVALRVKISHLHARESGPFGYIEKGYFPQWSGYERKLQDSKIRIQKDAETGDIVKTNIEYADHFFRKYGDKHEYLPIWMAIGMMEYGMLTYFFVHSTNAIQDEIAREWNTSARILRSWLSALRPLRNVCAHHGRIWNRVFTSSPRIPSKSVDERWYYVYSEKANKWVRPTRSKAHMTACQLNSQQCAAFLFLCRHLMKQVAPTSHWKERVEKCLQDAARKGIPLSKIGLPEHWETHPLWK